MKYFTPTIFIIVVIALNVSIIESEFISLSIGAAVLAGLGYNYDTLYQNTYCLKYECCINDHIPANIDRLQTELKSDLFGQNLAINYISSAFRSHYKNIENSPKALAITLHGTTGTGKNYATDIIIRNIFKYGEKSKYIKKYLGRLSFPSDNKVNEYREFLLKDITDAVTKCPKSIFIFDEVDKMPEGILESISPLLDHHENINGINFRQAVFIFLTNAAGAEVTFALAAMMRKGKVREDIHLKEFEYYCQMGAYNIDGGLKYAGIIESSLIDHYIPLLPLELKHVEKCIEVEYTRHAAKYSQADKDYIISEMTMDPDTGLFVFTGCKRIKAKVGARINQKQYS